MSEAFDSFEQHEIKKIFSTKLSDQFCLILKCSLCSSVFVDPIQTNCGCRFCLRCIQPYLEEEDSQCPKCGLELLKCFLKDKAIEKEISNTELKCLNDICDYKCLYKNLKSHLECCEYRLENCQLCHMSYLYFSKDEHFNNVCPKTTIQCDECQMEMTREFYVNYHKNLQTDLSNLCHKMKIKCPHGCSEEIRQNIPMHLIECPKRPEKCPMSEFGCSVVTFSEEMSKHLQTNLASHQILVMKEIACLKNVNENLNNEMKQVNKNATAEILYLKQSNLELMNIIKNFENKEKDRNKEIDQIKYDLSRLISNQLIGSINTNEIFVVDGYYIWIIRDFKQKYYLAKTGERNYVTSEEFYVNNPGYKMCLKIYPNGDGRGKDKFLSIYFVILKGKYDDIITWPFPYKASFTIISSEFNIPEATISLKSDNNHSCYGKPINEANVGAGHPEFISLFNLLNTKAFLHEGALKIKFKIIF